MPDSQPHPQEEVQSPGDRRPSPDPTILTTQALYREVSGLRELIELRIEGVLGTLTEKFRRVDQQFELVERQRVEQKNDTKNAVDAAITAQKEAVKEQTTASERSIAKSEAATSKQLDQIAATFETSINSLREAIDDVKERVIAVDKKASGTEDRKQGADAGRTALYAAIGVAAVIVTAVLSFIAAKGP